MRLQIATKEEMKYALPQPARLYDSSGAIGCLTGNVCNPWYFWETHIESCLTDNFYQDLNKVMSAFFEDGGVLSCPSAIDDFTSKNQKAKMQTDNGELAYAFRLDTEKYTFMIRLIAQEIMDDNYSICCYVREFLNTHIVEAREGIQLNNLDDSVAFRIEDGGLICIQPKSGKLQLQECRFVGPNQYLIGGEFHIAEDGLMPIRTYFQPDVKVFPLWSALPKACMYIEPQSGQMIRIQRGVRGYTIVNNSNNPWINRQEVKNWNKGNNLTNGQIEAMYYGCTHSWDDPKANPANYNANGQYIEEE